MYNRTGCRYVLGPLWVLLFAVQVWPLAAQTAGTGEGPPVVRAGAMPLYPVNAEAARVQGVVKLKVVTDGKSVATVEVVSGPAMLAEAAKKTVQTWVFDSHSPATFFTTFEYRMVDPAQCFYSNSSVTARLPLEVHVSTNELMTCDPSSSVTSTVQTGTKKGPEDNH
jgi:hypothetical protein